MAEEDKKVEPEVSEEAKAATEEVVSEAKTEETPETAKKQPTVPVRSEGNLVSPDAKAKGRRGAGRRGSRDQAGQAQVEKDTDAPEVMEKVISINRITKVTKGGKKLSFRALVVVGDTMGKVGYSCSKASEVSIAIRKALSNAKKSRVKIPMRGSTITHEIIGECAGAEVLLKPASEGTGVIASGPVRAVCDGAGIHNILTKCHRSNNPINVVKATFDGLTRLKVVKK